MVDFSHDWLLKGGREMTSYDIANAGETRLAPHGGCNWQGCRECFPKGKEFVYLVVCSGRVVAAFAGYEEARRQAIEWNARFPEGNRFGVEEWLVHNEMMRESAANPSTIPVTE